MLYGKFNSHYRLHDSMDKRRARHAANEGPVVRLMLAVTETSFPIADIYQHSSNSHAHIFLPTA
jgi:hypothetical protein